MIEVEEIVEPPIDVPKAAQGTLRIGPQAFVGNDRQSRFDELSVEVLRRQSDLAADPIDRDPDLDALGQFGDECVAEECPDIAGLPAVDEQGDRRGRGSNVLEHAREVQRSVKERLDIRRPRLGEGHRHLLRADLGNRSEPLGVGLAFRRRERAGGRWTAPDEDARRDDGAERGDEGGEGEEERHLSLDVKPGLSWCRRWDLNPHGLAANGV